MARRGTTGSEIERILILAKTYPTPSSGYVETTCVAGVSETGELRRVFPVSFRLLPDSQKFKKWQWVTAGFRPPNNDRRPESRRIDVDSLVLGSRLETGRDRSWSERMMWIEPHIIPSFASLETRRQATGETLGFLRPSRIIGVDVTMLPENEREWTEEELEKLTRDMGQGDLFADNQEVSIPRMVLQKLPFQCHYRYEIDTPDGPEQLKHMVTDWEMGLLYRNCLASHKEDWQIPFRAKLETEFAAKNLVFMMGTLHRFPKQWLIISLIYPPHAPASVKQQPSLDL